MSCYVNDIETFAVILNTICEINDKRTSHNMYERSFFIGFLNNNKVNKEKLKESLLKCYKAQVLSYKKRYGEKTEKIDPYYDKNGEYYLNSNYVKKCFDLLGFNNREKSAVLDILKKNKIDEKYIGCFIEKKVKNQNIKQFIKKIIKCLKMGDLIQKMRGYKRHSCQIPQCRWCK